MRGGADEVVFARGPSAGCWSCRRRASTGCGCSSSLRFTCPAAGMPSSSSAAPNGGGVIFEGSIIILDSSGPVVAPRTCAAISATGLRQAKSSMSTAMRVVSATQADVGDIAKPNEGAFVLFDDQLFELIGGVQVRVRRQVDLKE